MPAEGLLAWSWLLIALPLAGAAVLLLGGRRTDRWGHLLGTATVRRLVRRSALLCGDPARRAGAKSVGVDLFTFISAGLARRPRRAADRPAVGRSSCC